MKLKQVAQVAPNLAFAAGNARTPQHQRPHRAEPRPGGWDATYAYDVPSAPVNSGWDEVGTYYTASNSGVGLYPAAGDTLSEDGRYLFDLTGGGGPTNNTVTHVAANLQFVGGTHAKRTTRAHTAANLQLAGGVHAISAGRKVAQVAPNFALAGGVHLKSTGRKVAHVGPNLGLLGGTHLRTLNRRITHVGSNLQLVGGTHTPLKAKVVYARCAQLRAGRGYAPQEPAAIAHRSQPRVRRRYARRAEGQGRHPRGGQPPAGRRDAPAPVQSQAAARRRQPRLRRRHPRPPHGPPRHAHRREPATGRGHPRRPQGEGGAADRAELPTDRGHAPPNSEPQAAARRSQPPVRRR